MSPKRALKWVVIWFMVAAAAAVGIYYYYNRIGQNGNVKVVEFITCYILEWTLSVDNLFVFLLIFSAFGVDGHRQLRALEWGIIGAIIMRMAFIVIGVAVVSAFEPILYAFGALLIYSAYHMAVDKGESKDVKNNALVKFARKRFRVTDEFEGDKFFTKHNGVIYATPMLLVVLTIESSDVMFAVDSIPAAFAVTRDPVIIFMANLCAIMGLRSLYFVLAHADKMFRFLKYGVVFILAFVGLKMMLFQVYHFNKFLSLGVVLGSLIMSMLVSLMVKKKD